MRKLVLDMFQWLQLVITPSVDLYVDLFVFDYFFLSMKCHKCVFA